MFIQTLFNNPIYFCMVCLIVVFSVCLHEYCHAWTAVREGDYTAADHLTLNPLKQMGFMSLLMLAFIGIAWGSVPVRRELLHSRRSMLRVSIAGPAVNFFLFLFAWIAFAVMCGPAFSFYREIPVYRAVASFVYHFGLYNFVLLAFNLIPAPGMDGWGVVSELFPRIGKVNNEVVKGAMLFMILLALVGVPYLFWAGAFLMRLGPLLLFGGG